MELVVRECAPQTLVVPFHEEVLGLIGPQPGARGRFTMPGEIDSWLTINHQRFRGPAEVSAVAPRGTLRLAMLGDSHTFGYGVNDDETYPAIVERRLNVAAPAGTRVEVLNAAVIGTGTGEEALWYERWVSAFGPSLVVLNVFHNDIGDDGARRLFTLGADGAAVPRPAADVPPGSRLRRLARRVPAYAWLVQHSHLVAAIRIVGARVERALQRGPAPASAAPAGTDGDRFRTDALALQAGEIVYLKDRAASRGARLIVVFLPARGEIYSGLDGAAEDRWQSEAMAASVARVCAEHGIPFLDATSTLRDRAAVSAQRFFLTEGDWHPTRAGYAATAEIVADFLSPFIFSSGARAE